MAKHHNTASSAEPLASEEESRRLGAAIQLYYTEFAKLERVYVPVSLDLLILYRMPDVALFVESPVGDASGDTGPRMRVLRQKGAYLSQAEVDGLSIQGVNRVFIKRSDVALFTQFVESLLSEIQVSSPMADEQKVTLLRTSAIQVMSDVFEQPTPANIERGVKVVSGFVYTLMRDPKAYQLLLNLSSHDHYTLQHSVGVGTLSIILAKKIGIHDEKGLIEAGVGGLLHDIGKTRVAKAIINKNGPLNEEEWAEMKKHSLYGFDILKDNPDIGMRAKLAVLQHHEDTNGTGYPMGLSGSQVSLFGKVVALADIFNALTTDRTYSTARPPFEAFAFIKEKLYHKVDPKLFEQLVLIYGGKV